MYARIFALLLLLAAALASSGCASVDESADDQLQTFHSTPETPGDDHGWGTSVSPLGH